MITILYVSYDGMTDALGRSQVLSLLLQFPKEEIKTIILSFEKKEKFLKGRTEIEKLINGSNIVWEPLFYTKKPPILSALYDVWKAKRKAKKILENYDIQIVHCRGYISSIIGNYLKKRFNIKFIFDMRGWWPDEKLESGYWKKNFYKPVYKYFKGLEKRFFSAADFIVSLTVAGKNEIAKQGLASEEKIGVIPILVNFSIFHPFDVGIHESTRKKLGINDRANILIHSGSVGGNYDLNKILKMFEYFAKRFDDSYLILLTKDKINLSFPNNRIIVASVPYNEVSDYLIASNYGLILYKDGFSNVGRSPTKLGEYWASGLPVISLHGIGDMDLLFDRYKMGGALLNSDLSDAVTKFERLTFTDRDQIRNYALDYYNEEKIKNFYVDIYRRLISQI